MFVALQMIIMVKSIPRTLKWVTTLGPLTQFKCIFKTIDINICINSLLVKNLCKIFFKFSTNISFYNRLHPVCLPTLLSTTVYPSFGGVPPKCWFQGLQGVEFWRKLQTFDSLSISRAHFHGNVKPIFFLLVRFYMLYKCNCSSFCLSILPNVDNIFALLDLIQCCSN